MKRRHLAFVIMLMIYCISIATIVHAQSKTTKALPGDPFAPYLNSVPDIINIIGEERTGTDTAAIVTRRFTFSSREGANIVYAIMAYPQRPGVFPAVLFLHGGGSNAEAQLGNVQRFAAHGYVTLAIDEPGICGANNTPNSSGEWKKRQGEAERLKVTPSPSVSTLADAGIANLQAFNLLASQTNVDAARMGISGSSWGGYSTTLLCGLLGKRVKAGYSDFGCGFYEKGSFWKGLLEAQNASDRDTWLTYFDAGRRAKSMTAAYFIEAPSNDTYFWPEAVQATLDAIRPESKNLVITPNINHKGTALNANMKTIFFDHYLRGIGEEFGKIRISNRKITTGGDCEVTMRVSVPGKINADSIALYYSEPIPKWQDRVWIESAATHVSGDTYKAIIPAAMVAKDPDLFGYMRDARGVITSSYMSKAKEKK